MLCSSFLEEETKEEVEKHLTVSSDEGDANIINNQWKHGSRNCEQWLNKVPFEKNLCRWQGKMTRQHSLYFYSDEKHNFTQPKRCFINLNETSNYLSLRDPQENNQYFNDTSIRLRFQHFVNLNKFFFCVSPLLSTISVSSRCRSIAAFFWISPWYETLEMFFVFCLILSVSGSSAT